MMILLKDIYGQITYFPRTIILTLVILPGYLFIKNNRGRVRDSIISALKQPGLLLFLIYLSFLLVSTLLSRTQTVPHKNVLSNFGLFDSNGLNMECIENTLLFVPYSFLYLQTDKPISPFKSVMFLVVCTTIFIEFAQLIFWLGEFQLSDLFHNIIGGVFGFIIWHIKEVLIYEY